MALPILGWQGLCCRLRDEARTLPIEGRKKELTHGF